MANEFRYTLHFDTALDPKGATAAQNIIERVDQAAGRADRRATESAAGIQRSLAMSAEKVRVNEIAYYDLDAAMRRTNVTTQSFTTGATKVKESATNGAASLLVFSQGMEDLQYGVRGVLNNIPQLVMNLGGGMGLAGAISIAAVAGSQLYEWLGKTEKQAGITAEKIDEIAQSIGQVQSDKIEAANDAIQRASAAVDAVRQNWEKTKAAGDSYANSALSNAEEIIKSERVKAQVLGQQVDAMREMDALAKVASDRRRLEAEQALRAEQEKINQANQTVSIIYDRIEMENALHEGTKADLEAARQKLAALRAHRDELKKQAEFDLQQHIYDDPYNPDPKISRQASQAFQAKKDLEALGSDPEMKGLEGRISNLEAAVDNTKKLEDLALKLAEAKTQADDTISGATIQIAEIQQTLSNADLSSAWENANQKGKVLAEEIKDFTSQIDANTTEAQAAKKTLDKAASDGIISVNELRAVGESLVILAGGLQAGVSATGDGVADLIKIVARLQTDAQRNAEQIKILQQKGGK